MPAVAGVGGVVEKDEVPILPSVAELVVFNKEEKLCEGVYMLLGPPNLSSLLEVDVLRMEESVERELVVRTCIA